MAVEIITQRELIEKFVEAIQAAGDSERNSFGFLMPGAYKDFVQQRRAVIAIDGSKNSLIGYSLYGGVCPQAKIFQTYVAPSYRGKNIGRRVLEAVFERLEANGFLSVIANVAADLNAANRFYEKMGFDVVTTKGGGKSRDRIINVRARELATPSLLELLESPADQACKISFRPPLQNKSPRYVLDLNVIFDVTKQRPRSKVARGVIAAGLENDVRLAVTTELIKELEKHSPVDAPDPILELCRSLPRLKLPSHEALEKYRQILQPIVFPDKALPLKLKANDEADLRHLATAIIESAAGFITSDQAILRASLELEKAFGLSVLSPTTFGQGFGAEFGGGVSMFVSTGNSTLESTGATEADNNCIDELLRKFHITDQGRHIITAAGTVTSPRRREIVRADRTVICFGSWDAPSSSPCQRELNIFAIESHPDASLAIKHVIEKACRDIGRQPIGVYRLKTQVHQQLVRSNAIALGFYAEVDGSPRNPVLMKACLGKAIVPEHWQSWASEIRTSLGLNIVGHPSAAENRSFEIEDSKGHKTTASLAEIESLLSPAIICADDRPGVIFPIWPSYAEELFQGSEQPNFLNHRATVLKPIRAYIGGNYNSVPEGGLAFFYESSNSGGRKAVIAVARLKNRYAMPRDQAELISADRGVLPDEAIGRGSKSKLVTVSEFDCLMRLSKPIGLAKLREMGCADGANFVTSKVIEPRLCAELIRAGAPHLG